MFLCGFGFFLWLIPLFWSCFCCLFEGGCCCCGLICRSAWRGSGRLCVELLAWFTDLSQGCFLCPTSGTICMLNILFLERTEQTVCNALWIIYIFHHYTGIFVALLRYLHGYGIVSYIQIRLCYFITYYVDIFDFLDIFSNDIVQMQLGINY